MPTKDIRRHRRSPYSGPVRISWSDARGSFRYAQAKCIDISQSGLRIELPEPIAVRTQVLLRLERTNLAGAAWVKHVSRHGARYSMGLELSQPLREPVAGLI